MLMDWLRDTRLLVEHRFLIEPWLPFALGLCLCLLVVALAGNRRTVLWLPSALLAGLAGLALLGDLAGRTWFLQPSGIIDIRWCWIESYLVFPFVCCVRPALPVCAAASALLYLLRRRKRKPLAAVLLSAYLLSFTLTAPTVYFRALYPAQYRPDRGLMRYDRQGGLIPTPYYDASRWWDEAYPTYESSPESCLLLTEPIPVYADASGSAAVLYEIPAGSAAYYTNFDISFPTIRPGWRWVGETMGGRWEHWYPKEPLPQGGYLRTADLLRAIRTADIRQWPFLMKLNARITVFNEEYRQWTSGSCLSPDLVHLYPPVSSWLAGLTLALCLAVWLTGRRRRVGGGGIRPVSRRGLSAPPECDTMSGSEAQRSSNRKRAFLCR